MTEQDEKIHAWKNAMITTAKIIFAKDKELMPVAMLYVEGGQNLIIGTPFTNQKEKELSASAIKKLVWEHKASAVIFIYEGYTITLPKEEMNKIFNPDGSKIKPIKDVDGRKEVVIIVFETKDGKREILTIEIDETQNDKVLGLETKMDGWENKLDGLFSNFFEVPSELN